MTYHFRLQQSDGSPADLSEHRAPLGPGDTIHLGRGRMLRVLAVSDDDAD
jgi:hypothetical protein